MKKADDNKRARQNAAKAARQPAPASRKVSLTDDQLARWNHVRERGGFGPVDRAAAEKRLSTMDEAVFVAAMERIG